MLRLFVNHILIFGEGLYEYFVCPRKQRARNAGSAHRIRSGVRSGWVMR